MKEGQCFSLHYSEEVSLKTKRKTDLRNIKFIISLFRSTIIPETENTYVEMKNNAYFQDWEKICRNIGVFIEVLQSKWNHLL
jgi:hypothetical protein